MVIACVALLVSMSGTAIAASPVVKRALFANNAGKLQGKTAVEVAGLPGPASTAAGLLSTKTAADSLGADAGRELTIGCDAGKKIVSGGFPTTGIVLPLDSRPTSETTWGIFLGEHELVSERRGQPLCGLPRLSTTAAPSLDGVAYSLPLSQWRVAAAARRRRRTTELRPPSRRRRFA